MKLETRLAIHVLVAAFWLLFTVITFGIWLHSVSAALFLFGAIQVATELKRE